jgi:hypothetical protein
MRFSVYCECADEDCTEQISITLEEWEQAKSAPNRTIACREHPLAAGERIVLELPGYVVAEGGTPPV